MKRSLSFVYEIAALYAFVAVIGFFVNDGNWSFTGFALHPFLFVIAIEASQYGLRPALMASFVGLGLYVVGSGGLGPGDSLPILAMLVTGILLGMVQEARNKQLREARHELDRSRTEQDRLRQRIQILTEANNELNERILGEVKTVSSFSEIARRLSVLDQGDLYGAICDLINDYLSATRSTVYELVGDNLIIKAAKGYVVVPEDLKQIQDKKSLAWRAVTQKQPLSALDLLKQDDNKSGLKEGQFPILMAAPIIEEGTQEVRGVICVNNLPFSKFHGASTKILGVVARWAADSLYNAEVVAQLRQKASQRG
jgi:polysaccharide biosynthesis protein PelD